MSNIPGRLNKVEGQLEMLALGYLSKRFNLNVEELEAAQKLKNVLTEHQYPETLQGSLTLFASHLGSLSDEWHKMRGLQVEAGLDVDHLAEITHEMTLAFEPSGPVTIETLIDLDRQIYEQAKLQTQTRTKN